MKLHFLGANRQVTGSRYCLETEKSRVVVDCGLFQERQFIDRNWRKCPIPPETINAMVVTHAHIDHCGLIPRLVKEGFNAPILTTHASSDLLEIMLKDAAHIQEEDARYKARRHKKEGHQGRYEPIPLFDSKDVEETLPLVQGVEFDKSVNVTEDISVIFRTAGHILGSAMLEVVVNERGTKRQIIFSGDIGQWDKPLLHDPTLFKEADYVVMESTYGDRNHEEHGDIRTQLDDMINRTIARRGKVVIPTFAVERAQEIIYFLSQLANDGSIPKVPVYIDSPMAIDVTNVFKKHHDRFDNDTWDRINSGDTPFHFPGLIFSRTAEQSKAINDVEGPAIIMSTSGMCTAGRIKHHLKRELGRSDSTILFVGYQAQGTLGRQILEGRKEVRIHGSMRAVKAEVAQIYGFSGHADRNGLLKWARSFEKSPTRVFLTHGDEDAAENLARQLREELNWDVLIPHYESTNDLR